MNNVVQFPISPLHASIKHKTFVTKHYTAACKLFDKWHTEYNVTGSKFAAMMAGTYLLAMDKLGSELDAMGGAL